MPAEREGNDVARRLRAAWAYSLLEQGELAKRTGIDYDRMRRLFRKDGPVPEDSEIEAIVAHTGVPRAFIEGGFTALSAGAGDVAAVLQEFRMRIARLELQLARLQRREGGAEGGTSEGHGS